MMRFWKILFALILCAIIFSIWKVMAHKADKLGFIGIYLGMPRPEFVNIITNDTSKVKTLRYDDNMEDKNIIVVPKYPKDIKSKLLAESYNKYYYWDSVSVTFFNDEVSVIDVQSEDFKNNDFETLDSFRITINKALINKYGYGEYMPVDDKTIPYQTLPKDQIYKISAWSKSKSDIIFYVAGNESDVYFGVRYLSGKPFDSKSKGDSGF